MLFLILVSLFTVLIIFLFKNKSDYWKKRNIIQVNGVIWDYVFGNCSLAEIYKRIYDKFPGEDHVGMMIGSDPTLLIRDLENVQAVLAGDFQSFYTRGITISPQDILADNVLFIDDFPRWKILRQKLSPCFTSLKLKNMFYIIERCARDFVEAVKEDPIMVQKPFNALYTYTTASIGASVFGIDTKTKNTMDSPFLDMAWRAVAPSFKSNLGFVISKVFPKILDLIDIKPFAEYEEFFVGVVKDVLEQRRKCSEKRHDFIDICLEIQRQGVMKDLTTDYELELSDELVAAQAFFFFLAGADTSANTMHFTLLELSNNPKILDKLHQEIDEVFTNCNENVTYNEIEKLPYLDMVINEALRKYPPIGLIPRQCVKSTVLPAGNLRIEKGVSVTIPVYGLHRDEKYFPDPEVFDPERFAPGNVTRIPKGCYLPFGEGNRICLGMRYSRLQVKSGLAWLLRCFTLRAQSYTPQRFERSPFSLRVSDAHYDLLPRNRS